MHPHLLTALDAAAERLRADRRVLGMYLHGSIGRGETDAYSDVDVCAVVVDDHYEDLRAGMRTVCEESFGPIVVWLPEGETTGYCNFAFLFQHRDELLLADFDIMAQSRFLEWRRVPDRVLWDRNGIISAAASGPAQTPQVSDASVTHLIDTYWVYAYLSGKYYRRGDVFKLLYVQQTLLHLHVRALGVLRHGSEGTWWAGDVAALTPRDRQRLRTYFTRAGATSVVRAFARSIDRFAADARDVCAARGLSYASAREAAVRAHLRAMGLPVA